MAREAGLPTADEQEEAANAAPAAPLWRRPRVRLLAVVLVLVVGLVLAGLWRSAAQSPVPLTRADVDRAVQSGIHKAQEDQRNAPPDAASAYRRILPSIVTVLAQRAATARSAGPAGADSDLGTGVVVSAQGAVLTALHVVDQADRIQLRFSDGTQAPATVLRRQPENDIAVLGPGRLPQVVVPAVLGGSARIGDAVFPVGNPLGLEDSLTAGVVSAVNRSIPTQQGRTLKGLIQFDAAVNPGNSGGPLLDRDGRVVGIVTALANPARQPYFVGIGFAVPIGTASGAAGGPSK